MPLNGSHSLWPRWLKLKQAARYSSIGKNKLIELAKPKIVVGFQDPDSGRKDWIFDKFSLDAYRESQSHVFNPRQKALDILSTVNP